MRQRFMKPFVVPGVAALVAVFGAGARADTRSFAAAGTGLAIEGPCARHVTVAVDPALAGRIAVTAEAGHPEEIERLAVGTANGRARVGLAPDRRECWSPQPHGTFRPTLALTVRVPAGFPVTVAESGAGDYALGMVGPLDVAGAGTVTLVAAGASGIARIELSGAGKVEVGRLEADRLRVDISGAGSVRVRTGRIDELAVTESGDGAVRIDPTVRDAELSVSGVGSIALGGVSGTLKRSVSGMATITVAGQRMARNEDEDGRGGGMRVGAVSR